MSLIRNAADIIHMSQAPQIDGFPLASDDPDYEIQRRINDFLAGPPRVPRWGTVASVLEGTPREERLQWVLPLLRRCEWLADNPGKPQSWLLPHLMNSASTILNNERALHGHPAGDDDRLLELLSRVSVFRKAKRTLGLKEFIPFAADAFHKARNKAEWIPVLQSVYFELEQLEEVRDGRYASAIGLALLVEGITPEAVPCWSSAVTSALAAMKKGPAAAWRSLFKAGHSPKASAMLQKIGQAEFVEQLDQWTRGLDAQQPVPLSWFGAELMKILLSAGGEIPASAPLVERIAKADWSPAERAATFLDRLVSATAPLPRAVELLEPLVLQNPSNASLHVALTDLGARKTPLGVDGYPLDERPEHSLFHRRIDEWFRLPGNPFQDPGPDLRTLSLGSDGKPDFPGLLAAMLDRIRWLCRQKDLVAKGFEFRMMLGQRLRGVAEKADLDEGGLNRLLELDALGALYCAPNDWLLPRVEKRIAEVGLSGELLTRVQAWHDAAFGTVAGQNLRQKLGWLLWHDDPRPMKAGRCWSSVIREDLRQTSPESAKHWRELLRKTSFAMVDTPPAKFRKECGPALEAIGSDAYADRFHAWLRPFSESAAIALEPPGRDLLRCLFWHAQEIHDSRIDEALGWFPPASWKNKKSAGYANKLLGPYIYAVSSRSPEFAHRNIEKLVSVEWIITGTRHYDVYKELCAKLDVQPKEGKAPVPERVPKKTLRIAPDGRTAIVN